ncbi:MAG: hypothetical protein Q9221_004206 [Calogaya cf. arnoldii]
MILLVLSYLLNFVAAIAIPATPPLPSLQSLTAGSTFNVPGSDVRVTLTAKSGITLHPQRIEIMMADAIYALGNSEADAGGSHIAVNKPETHFQEHGLRISVTDLTYGIPNPEANEGMMKWGELRAIYQGVRAHMKDLENLECDIRAWRMKTEGRPRRERKIKDLAEGTFGAAALAGDLGLDSFRIGNSTE